jgi:hypothetical protein
MGNNRQAGRRRVAFAWAAGLALTLVLGTAVALAAVKAGRYSGTTSEKGPVTLTVANGKITGFHAELGYNGRCGQGGGPVLTASPGSIPIHNGRFSANVRLRLKTVVNDAGTIEGRASGSKVSGTIVELLNGKANRCYTETFTARRH